MPHQPRARTSNNVFLGSRTKDVLFLRPAPPQVVPEQHHLTGTIIFGASSHSELKTLATIVDTAITVPKAPQNQLHHVRVVNDAARDLQIVRRVARRPLHRAMNSSLGTQALHLWVALRNLPWHIVLHLIKQVSHHYNWGNERIDLHAHNQLAEHVPTP